jgi:hypothetical protein
MGAGRHAERGELRWVPGIAHVHDRRAVRTANVADIGDAVLDHDLASAGTVEISELSKPYP